MSDLAEWLRRMGAELDAMSEGLDIRASEIEDAPPLDVVKARRMELDALSYAEAGLRKELEGLRERHQAVADILDFYDDKLTHVVIRQSAHSAPNILTFRDALQRPKKAGWSDHYLLGLRPDERGVELVWGRNQYADGSGRWVGAAVCRSFDEAAGHVQRAFEADVQAWRESKGRGTLNIHLWQGYRDTGVGVLWPDALVEAIVDSLNTARSAKVAEAFAAVERAQSRPVLTEAAWLGGGG